MTKKQTLPLLLSDDLTTGEGREKRSMSVRFCADQIARKLGCSIVMVYVESEIPNPIRVGQYKRLVEQYRQEKMKELDEASELLHTPSKALILDGEPAEELLSLVKKRDSYEMLVLGTHGRKGLRRLILGSVAEEVIRQATLPVMTVGPVAQEKASQFFSKSKTTILIPTGLTANSIRAEVYGVSLARRLEADVIFFHSMYDALHPVLQTAFSVPTPPTKIRTLFKEMKSALLEKLSDKVEKASQKGIPAAFVLDDKSVSSAESVLKEASRSSASLIVMGTHGRTMASGAFFGRTARDVILAASVPVVTVHSRKL